MSELLEAHTTHCGATRTDTLINALGSHPTMLTLNSVWRPRP